MKKILSVAVLLITYFCAFTQVDSIRLAQNHIFQYIDKSQIPTGYLEEYGPQVVEKKWLTGTLADSNFIPNIDIFNFLYNDIENSKIWPSGNTQSKIQLGLQPLDSARQMIDIARYDTLTNLAIFSANYAVLKEDAIQLNLFTHSNNQIFDVQGRTQSPYLLNHAFAAVPVLTHSPFPNQIKLSYQPLFYSNTNYSIASIYINFLDGEGYKAIFVNGITIPLTKTYTDSTGFKKFAVKVTYTNGLIDECYTGQTVEVIANQNNNFTILSATELATPNHSIPPITYLNINPTIPSILLNNPNFPTTQRLVQLQQFKQNMKLYIRYSKKREGTQLEGKIVKPFIVVEGYDITDASPLLKTNNYDINSLLEEWDKRFIKDVFDLNKNLDEIAGYDLIFIDYYTMRNITENADYLQQAIDWINSQKVNNEIGIREQNVVLGISMGGLVSRYALAKRTKQIGGNPTETKMLFTMDSPHQGANVPVGLQHFLYDFGEVRIVKKLSSVSDELKAFYDLNNQPATQQQLILRVINSNNSNNRVSNSFLAEGGVYRSMIDYNAPYPFYAISNGSQCATQVMQPSTLLLKKDADVATAYWLSGIFAISKYRMHIQVNSLPTYGTTSQVCYVKMERRIKFFFGLIGTGWKKTSDTDPRLSPQNTIPWDGVQGGVKMAETTGPISQAGIFPPVGKQNTFLGNAWRVVLSFVINVNYNVDLPFSQKEFSFVPITSALDVQNVTSSTFNSSYIFPINGQNGSRAHKYVSHEFFSGIYNKVHTDFTPRNARWLFNEMEGITQPTEGCEGVCSPTEIIGPSSICSSAVYRLNIPSTTAITWSVSPSGIASHSSNGNNGNNERLVTRITDGTITLSATTNAATCPKTVSKIITLSNYTLAGNMYNSVNTTPVQFNGNGQYSYVVTQRGSWVGFTFNITTNTNLTNLKWYRDDINLTGTGNVFNTGVQASIYGYGTVSTNVRLEADAPCGKVRFDFGIQIQSLGWFYEPTVSPNPATDNINVNVKKVEYENAKEPTAELLEYVKTANTTFRLIDNNTGAIVKNWQLKGIETSNYTFNIANVRNGLYTLQMERLGQKYNNQILITR